MKLFLVEGNTIDLTAIEPQSRIGEWIMLEAMAAQNAQDRRIDIDTTYP